MSLSKKLFRINMAEVGVPQTKFAVMFLCFSVPKNMKAIMGPLQYFREVAT